MVKPRVESLHRRSQWAVTLMNSLRERSVALGMTRLVSRASIAGGMCLAMALAWHPSGTVAGSSSDGCVIKSQVLSWSMDRIRANPSARARQLSCKEIATIQAVNPESLEVTTGRISGKPVICMSSSRSMPCLFILADLSEDGDPTSILAEIFNYQQNPTVLNETVERLFIRPAKYIK